MGNETSAVKIHSLLTADDLKRLRAGFPEGAVGPRPPTDLEWGVWKEAWTQELRDKWKEILSVGNSDTKAKEISFERYQEVAGNVVRGNMEERIKLLFVLLSRAAAADNSKLYEHKISLSSLTKFIEDVVSAGSRILGVQSVPTSCTFARSMVHDLAFPDKARKECLHSEFSEHVMLDFDAVERWTAIHCPLFDQIFLFTLSSSFGLVTDHHLVPIRGSLKFDVNTMLSPADVFFLNSAIPNKEGKERWRPLFNTVKDGESFSKFLAAVSSKNARGPTLMVVKESGENGHVFGAYASEPWALGPKFYGNSSSFLFNLHPRYNVYEATCYNSNYQYFNSNAKTLPNGVGLGGQLEFFGLWLDSEFGKGRCSPSCSSFRSPQLSRNENFTFTQLEVWGIGDEPRDEDEDEADAATGSVLDKDPQAMAVMEMMGKTFISKDVKAADENMEKN